ncbi:MAG: hypothetical protein ACTS7C_00535, partial [Candidatus Hodgkinia cicadicola]
PKHVSTKTSVKFWFNKKILTFYDAKKITVWARVCEEKEMGEGGRGGRQQSGVRIRRGRIILFYPTGIHYRLYCDSFYFVYGINFIWVLVSIQRDRQVVEKGIAYTNRISLNKT